MKGTLQGFFVFMLAISLAHQVWAAEPLALSDVHVGFGFGLGTSTSVSGSGDTKTSSGSMAVLMPMLFSKNLKLEPEFGFSKISIGSGAAEQSMTSFRFGLGAFYTSFRDRLALQVGLKMGVVPFLISVGETENIFNNFDIGPVFGLEYFVSEQFSLGGAIQLAYIHVGKVSEDQPDTSVFGTQTTLMARFYFGGKAPPASSLSAPVVSSNAPIPDARPAAQSQGETSVSATGITEPKAVGPATAEAGPARTRSPAKVDPIAPPKKQDEPPQPTETLVTPECPAGSEKVGAAPPKGFEQYCVLSGQKTKHGWFVSWFENGRTASQGEYRQGNQHGQWVFYYSDGQKRLEAEYQDGKQVGHWVFWSRDGKMEREVNY